MLRLVNRGPKHRPGKLFEGGFCLDDATPEDSSRLDEIFAQVENAISGRLVSITYRAFNNYGYKTSDLRRSTVVDFSGYLDRPIQDLAALKLKLALAAPSTKWRIRA